MNQPDNSSKARGATRREFLKKSTLAGAALVASQNLFRTPVYGQTTAPSANVLGANARLVVGYIGLGLQGTAHMNLQLKNATANNIVQAAVCALSKQRLADAKKWLPDATQFEKLEDLLARKDIDAVTISTADQWHADAAMMAVQAGKHVYLEKPMTRYLGEAFALYDRSEERRLG